jgi:hypothetical protein
VVLTRVDSFSLLDLDFDRGDTLLRVFLLETRDDFLVDEGDR